MREPAQPNDFCKITRASHGKALTLESVPPTTRPASLRSPHAIKKRLDLINTDGARYEIKI